MLAQVGSMMGHVGSCWVMMAHLEGSRGEPWDHLGAQTPKGANNIVLVSCLELLWCTFLRKKVGS